IYRVVHARTRAPAMTPVEKVIRGGLAAGLEQQRLLISRNGTERPIDESAAPIRDSQGHFLGVVLVFRDVTERQRIEEKLQDADRRKDEFLATLAHELRNPLAPIRHGLQILDDVGS